MNRRKPPRATMTVTGGTFIGSALGQSNKVSRNTIAVGSVQPRAPLEDLRKAIATAREKLIGLAGSPETQADVRYEIRKVEEELAADEPERAVVRSRWEQIAKALGPLATTSANIMQITDLITKVFGRG